MKKPKADENQKNAHSMIALVDVNNFFVSCERVFQPKLEKKTGYCIIE